MDTELIAEIVNYMGRKAVALRNDNVSALIDALGGMMPEFSLRQGRGGINAHWIPDFRDNSGKRFSESKHAAYWKVKLLYLICGDFPCSPNFGPACRVDGVDLPAHGWAANEKWKIGKVGISSDNEAAYARFSMESPNSKMPLVWDKCDLLLDKQNAYYSVMRIRNTGREPISINLTRHNTLGAPFLQAGCRISLSADRFQSAPAGTEFDSTGRLVQGCEFSSLSAAPLRTGGFTNIGFVPGMIGYTDFVTGAIPDHLSLGWSCVVNPLLGLAYVSFFPGAAMLPPGEIALGFNDLWMQYGGRSFTPWALHDGGTDRTFCLGTENAVGAFASGLEYSRKVPEIMGTPTMVTVPANGERKLCYGSALLELDPRIIAEGVMAMEAEDGGLVIKSNSFSQ